MTERTEITWHLPAHIDDSGAENLHRHIEDVAGLQPDSFLILNLESCCFFDFEGAKLLLKLIATARHRNIATQLVLGDRKLAALLRFMQFDFITKIKEGEQSCH